MSHYHGNDLDLGRIAGLGRRLILTRQERGRHFYIPGMTRCGKTKLMEGCIRQDLANWHRSRSPVIVFDPHGTLYQGLMSYIAAERLWNLPVIPIDLSQSDYTVAYNPLRPRDGDPAVFVQGVVGAIVQAWGQKGLQDTPRLARWLPASCLALYEQGATLQQMLPLLGDRFVRAAIVEQIKHPTARMTFERAANQKEAEVFTETESSWNKVEAFIRTSVMRAMLCQVGASLDFAKVLHEGSIVLINLSTAGSLITDEDANTLGSIMLTDLFMESRRRGKAEDGTRPPAYVWIDEAHRYVSPALAEGFPEASGFSIHLSLANQSPSFFVDKGDIGKMVWNAIEANVQNVAAFRLRHSKDLPLVAMNLFRQHLDVDAVKHEIYSTKTVGHDLVYLPSYSTGTSVGNATGTSTSEAVTDSHTIGSNWSHTDSLSHTDSSSASLARSLGASASEQWADSAGESGSTGTSASTNASEGRGLSGTLLDENGNDLTGGGFPAAYGNPGNSIRSWNQTTGLAEGTNASDGWSRNRSEGGGLTRSDSSSIGESYGVADTVGSADSYGGSEAFGTAHTVGHGTNESRSVGTSTSRSMSPMLIPIWGTELSSRTFYTLDEQLHRLNQRLDAQPVAEFTVRTANALYAFPINAHFIKVPAITAAGVSLVTLAFLKKLPFAKPLAEALIATVKVHENFARKILGYAPAGVEEPGTAIRVAAKVISEA